ncbi:MAG: zinc ABC transporter substrate-binding protein [Cytophagales bacterium]|nr:zinc ABC transporter substrate-binding protein [Cytophagales bacterium]
MKLFKHLLFSLWICITLIQCGKKKGDGNEVEKPSVVCTTGMIADAARNIVGDKMEVTALMGSGVDPHLYKASQSDLYAITNSDIVFYNGLHLEGKMTDIFEKFGRQKVVVAVADGISKNKLRLLDANAGTYDPHVWFDVSIWKDCVKQMLPAINKLDPKNKAYYQANAEAYLAKLDSLHEQVKIQIASIPADQRVLITAHDAFGYFGQAYQMEVKGLQGISTLSEFGLKDITDLVNDISNRKIKAVFVESSVPNRSIEAVLEGCQKKGHQVQLGGTLYSDAMGQEGTPEGTYIGMVSANVAVMVKALR